MTTKALDALQSAVLDIATSRAKPSDRLADAVITHLTHLDPDSLDDRESSAWLRRIVQRATAQSVARGRCAIVTGVSMLADEDVEGLLLEIVDLYEDLVRQDARVSRIAR